MKSRDVCTCGHDSDEHVTGDPSYPRRCTVCTCNAFDWDVEASDAAYDRAVRR